MSDRQNSLGEGHSSLDDWSEAEYQAALERVSREAGVEPGEFQRRVSQSAEGLRLTPECLTLTDIEHFPRFADLPGHRQAHVRECGTCTDFLATLEPRPGELDDFLGMAREARHQSQQTETLGLAGFFGVPKVEMRPALVGATTAWLIALIAALPLYRSFVETPKQVAAVVETFTSDRVVLAAIPSDQLQLARESLVAGGGIDSIDAAARQVLDNALSIRHQAEDKRQPPVMSLILARDEFTRVLQAAAPAIQEKPVEPVGVPLTTLSRVADISWVTARDACEKTPLTTGAVRTSFNNLLAANSGDVDSWGAHYLAIHQYVKGLSGAPNTGEPLSPSQLETVNHLRLCDEHLRLGARLRYVINNQPKGTQFVSVSADSAASLSLGLSAWK